MAAEWYYTTNKQQMGPVSWNELRELAEVDILKPHDMVWCDGMDEWVKAINQNGLFAEGDGDGESPKKKKAAYSETKPPPGRRTRRREEVEEEEEDDRDTKKKGRKREEERAKMAVGLKVGLILGGIFVVLLFGVSCVGGLIFIAVRGGGGGGGGGGGIGQPNNVRANYTVINLQQQRFNERRFNFTQGRRVVITVTCTNLQFGNTDVDLHILRGNNRNPIAVDLAVPQQNRHCRVEFVVPANDTYTVHVRNLGPGMAFQCQVNVDER